MNQIKESTSVKNKVVKKKTTTSIGVPSRQTVQGAQMEEQHRCRSEGQIKPALLLKCL